MKTINPEELKTILENHKHWLYENCEGWENMKADLTGADLRGAYLRGAYLTGADLSDAYLRGAYLSGADLRGAYLRGADLSGADLRGADLRGAYLRGADLTDAYLRGAYLSGAYLTGADLSGADLTDAYLSGADLTDAYLSGAKNTPYIPMVCPEEGKFIGWKKAEVQEEEENHYRKVIVKLEIPASAKRSSATSRKCRCNKAKVLEIYNFDGTVAKERKCYSDYNNDFIYEVGKTVKVDDFCKNRWNECAQGIHFFINRQEAINY